LSGFEQNLAFHNALPLGMHSFEIVAAKSTFDSTKCQPRERKRAALELSAAEHNNSSPAREVLMEERDSGKAGVDKLPEQAYAKAGEKDQRARWLQWLAMATALFAVVAAIASLKSGQVANTSLINMNEATLKQAQAADAWAYFQAKGIKQVTREAEEDLLSASHAPDAVIAKAHTEADRLKSEQEEIQKEARSLEQEQQRLVEQSRRDLERLHRFFYSIAMLQVAIGLSAIAALVGNRGIWFGALVGGLAGIGLLLYSLV